MLNLSKVNSSKLREAIQNIEKMIVLLGEQRALYQKLKTGFEYELEKRYENTDANQT